MRKMTLAESSQYLNRSFVLDPSGKSNRATIFEKRGDFVPSVIIGTVLWPTDWLEQVKNDERSIYTELKRTNKKNPSK